MIDSNKDISQVKVYSGDLEVIGNGIIPATNNHNLKIKIQELEIEFFFKNDDAKDPKIDRQVSDKKLNISLYNFNNPLGIGMLEPQMVGHIDKREMFLSFFVWTPSSDDNKRLINWTLLKGGEFKENK